jgi:hypothetical protein
MALFVEQEPLAVDAATLLIMQMAHSVVAVAGPAVWFVVLGLLAIIAAVAQEMFIGLF